MLLYTHIITARRISDILGLELKNSEAYLLGAILPDIRYLAGLPREQTHLPLEQFMAIARQCPASERDLLTGYLVHLIADEFAQADLRAMMFPLLPGSMRRHIKVGVLNIMLEIGYRHQTCGALLFSREARCLGRHLALPEEQVVGMVEQVEGYLSDPSLEETMKTLGSSSLNSNRNIRFYLRVGRTLYQMKFIRRFITAKVNRIREEMEQTLARRCRPWMEQGPFKE